MSRADRRLPDRGTRRRGSSDKAQRAMNVQQALEWAFGVEKARLELPDRHGHERTYWPGFGMEYVLIQRARLGRQIDGGRHKMGTYTHPDAEVIAATVAGMPDDMGGLRMAIRVVELARAGLTPDWMPGAVPRCVPLDWRRTAHSCSRCSLSATCFSSDGG